jgi:cytochrome c-type biogenesis protein CcmH/NrfF
MRRFLRISLLAGAAALLAAQTVRTGNQMEHRLRQIGEKLKCFCGEGGRTCSYTVGSCNMLNCHFREEVKAQIRPLLQAGWSESAILARLQEKYGTMILGAPPAQGFNLLGYLMPSIALALGLIAIRYVIVRWRSPRPLPSAGPPVEKYRDQIEKELADLE